MSVYGPLLRYPHPPLNQSSYTIFSFHRTDRVPPPPGQFFLAPGCGVAAGAACLARPQGARGAGDGQPPDFPGKSAKSARVRALPGLAKKLNRGWRRPAGSGGRVEYNLFLTINCIDNIIAIEIYEPLRYPLSPLNPVHIFSAGRVSSPFPGQHFFLPAGPQPLGKWG